NTAIYTLSLHDALPIFTKKISELQGQIKEYTGTITLGATTPSYDLETEINETFPTEHITDELILETTKQFIGIIDQFPPIFSARSEEHTSELQSRENLV